MNKIKMKLLLRACEQRFVLIYILARRDFQAKYRGSMLGLLWSILQPLMLLAVYTFVFSIAASPHKIVGDYRGYALEIFAALLMFNFFSESFNRSGTLILSHHSYVKKVIFPLEILSVIVISSAFLQMMIGYLVWNVFYFVVHATLQANVLVLPLIWLPLILMVLGISWIVAATGVIWRDVGHITSLLTTVLMFMTPIFYHLSSLPDPYKKILSFNPLSMLIEMQYQLLVGDGVISYALIGGLVAGSAIFCMFALLYFQRLKPGFADVV